MYNFIFYFFYKLIEKRNPDPNFGAASAVAFAQVIHVFMIIAVIKYFGDFSIPRFHEDYFLNKWINAPILLVWLIIAGWYYNKNFGKIIEKFRNKKKHEIYSYKYILLVIIAYLVPLLIGIKFINLAAAI
jgi:hypothetical protein